jgi:hypothetical protein
MYLDGITKRLREILHDLGGHGTAPAAQGRPAGQAQAGHAGTGGDGSGAGQTRRLHEDDMAIERMKEVRPQ